MVFSEPKGHKVFKGHKVPFKVTWDLKVPKEPKVSKVLKVELKELRVQSELKELKGLKEHKVDPRVISEGKVLKAEQETQGRLPQKFQTVPKVPKVLKVTKDI
jgi:hypothetical protein